ncbi:cytochrome b [Allorhizobium terrae]|nr:cytochrome b [Allorhizobium terrae]
MMDKKARDTVEKYPLSMRAVHWLRACLVLGLLVCGWYMTGLPEGDLSSFLYKNHKKFGILVWLVALLHLGLRWRYKSVLPSAPQALAAWEKLLSHLIHRLIIALTLLVPMMGYLLSSTFTQSDGVPFFFIARLPDFLPKNDAAFEVFQTLHKYSAYLLLACVVLHVAGALKHRFQDKGGKTDVLPRMM